MTDMEQRAAMPGICPMTRIRAASSILLCKSFCKVSDSTTEQRNLHHQVGDAAGIMPV